MAEPAHKTPKECNSELYSRQAAIKAAGETPARFVHDCWWHSQAGRPTTLVGPGAVPAGPPREAKAAQTGTSRVRAAGVHRVASAHLNVSPRHAGSRLEEARHRRDQRVVEARLERSKRRVARALRAILERDARDTARRAPRWSVAATEGPHSRLRREGLDKAGPGRVAARTWTDQPVPADVATAAADLGPAARAGRRMRVRVVAAGEITIKPAVAVGGLTERASAGALNCWGQPVLLIGRKSDHWSREMVCDGKPAGANEWSATIYYGGSAAR